MALASSAPSKVAAFNRFFSLRLVSARALPATLLVAGFWAAAVVCGVLVVRFAPMVPPGIFVPVAVAAGFLLQAALLALTYAVLTGCFVTAILLTPHVETSEVVGGVVLIITMGIMFAVAQSRSRLGVTGMNADALLTDLRDRLKATGKLPPLPETWGAEIEIQSAYGQGLSGDFVVTARRGNQVQIALVDVSGKGLEAGTRSLLLAGAFSSLLGAVSPEDFLAEANRFLLAQRWEDDFATAVHVSLDLDEGTYSIGHAGHPTAAIRSAGSGRWLTAEGASGCALGIIDGVGYRRTAGRLDHGDALLLYTDGLIESRDRPLRQGLDRILGRADLLVGAGYSGGAKALVKDAAGGVTDDRAAVLLWRR